MKKKIMDKNGRDRHYSGLINEAKVRRRRKKKKTWGDCTVGEPSKRIFNEREQVLIRHTT